MSQAGHDGRESHRIGQGRPRLLEKVAAVWAVLALCLAAVVFIVIGIESRDRSGKSSEALVLEEAPPRVRAWNKVAFRLHGGEEASRTLAANAAGRLSEFFAERKQAVRPFAEEVLSLRGKWELLKSKLPFTEDDSYEQYVRGCFERHVFTPDELQERLQSVVASYLSELQGVENQLLVAVRADLSDRDFASLDLPAGRLSEEGFHRDYAKLCQDVLKIADRDLQVTAARELTSFVASDIGAAVVVRALTALAPRLGLSGTILGAGTASSLLTLGAGLAVAIIVERIIDWVLCQAGYDPEAQIAAQVAESLGQLEALLLDGDPAAGLAQAGMRSELLRLHEERARLREAALRRLTVGDY